METKICTKCGIEKSLEDFRKNRNGCKQCERDYAKKYRNSNHDIVKERTKKWRDNNKEKIREYDKKRKRKYIITEERKTYSKNYMKKWRQENKDHIKKYKKEDYHRNKNKKIYKLKLQIRNLIFSSFKKRGLKKSSKTENILGCSLDYFIEYLLKTFENNYGYEWDKKESVHIDHIIPLATAENEDEVIKLNHYTNLQLLKAEDNLKKSNKLNWTIKEG